VRPNGDVIELGPAGGPALPVTKQAVATAAGQTDGGFSDHDVDGLHLRVLTATLGPIGAVQVARSLEDADRVLERLRNVLVALVAVGTALAAGVSRLFSRRVVAPVTELTEAAEHIEATGDLGRRVDAGGDDEVGRMAARFNAMLARLQTSQAQQRQLVADASHELRTPVTSMRTNVEVLRDAPAMDDADRRALLDDVVEQAEELGNLVGDLIALARDGEAPPATEDVRLDELVAEAVVRARRHAPAVDFTLRTEPSVVSAAPDRIGRAVNNLLDNAAQHADRVEVTVSADGVVAVRDHGPGVPPEDVPLVFDRFYRGATARGALGLGPRPGHRAPGRRVPRRQRARRVPRGRRRTLRARAPGGTGVGEQVRRRRRVQGAGSGAYALSVGSRVELLSLRHSKATLGGHGRSRRPQAAAPGGPHGTSACAASRMRSMPS